MNFKFVGKVLISSLFIVSALNTIIYGPNHFIEMIESKHIPMATLITILLLSLKLVCGFTIIFSNNKKYVNISCYCLIVFTFLATMLFHNAFLDRRELNVMLGNIAVIGGLLLIIE
jgi:uncharacterized membrane protein YphA (DoxX/SURF4 family)